MKTRLFGILAVAALATFALIGCAASQNAARQIQTTKEMLQEKINDPATLPAEREADQRFLNELNKASGITGPAAAGDTAGTLAGIGALLPPPWGTIVSVAGLALSGFLGWKNVESNKALASYAGAIQRVQASNPSVDAGIKAKADLMDAKLTPAAKKARSKAAAEHIT